MLMMMMLVSSLDTLTFSESSASEARKYALTQAKHPTPCNVEDSPVLAEATLESKHEPIRICKTNPDSPAFEIRPVEGAGLGMVATRDIKRGEAILVEAPVIRTDRGHSTKNSLKQFANLGQAVQDQVLALFNMRDDLTPLEGIIWSNAIGLRDTDEEIGLFIQASRINHACRPNTNNSWDRDTGFMTITCTWDIEKGEEITSTYIEGFATRQLRRKHLMKLLQFQCECLFCTLPVKYRNISDGRIVEIDNILHGFKRGRKWKAMVRLSEVQTLLELYKDERVFDWHPAEAYALAFDVCRRKMDGYRAVIFAQRATKGYEDANGWNSVEAREWRQTLSWMRGLVATGEAHKVEYDKPPTDEQKLENWLFQESGNSWSLLNEHCLTSW